MATDFFMLIGGILYIYISFCPFTIALLAKICLSWLED